MVDELMQDNNDLHKNISSLRYTLEILIMTNLLISEKDYFLKVYYSRYKHKENKSKQMLVRLKNELVLLEKYFEEYSEQIKELKLGSEREKIFQFYKKQIQGNINLIFSQLEEFGFEYLIAHIKEKTLPEYEKKLKEDEVSILNEAKHLSKEAWFKNYSEPRIQPNKVFKKFADGRSWSKKAEDAGLTEEYQLNYEMTSSLLHCTSYSLFTSNVISNNEKEYNYMILNQYIEQITTKISAFSRVIIFDLFKVIKV